MSSGLTSRAWNFSDPMIADTCQPQPMHSRCRGEPLVPEGLRINTTVTERQFPQSPSRLPIVSDDAPSRSTLRRRSAPTNARDNDRRQLKCERAPERRRRSAPHHKSTQSPAGASPKPSAFAEPAKNAHTVLHHQTGDYTRSVIRWQRAGPPVFAAGYSGRIIHVGRPAGGFAESPEEVPIIAIS